jgi:phospholipid transport system substrate-binding protein
MPSGRIRNLAAGKDRGTIRKFVSGLLLISILLTANSTCVAEEPLSILGRNISELIRILKDPQYADATQKAAQFQSLVDICLNLFDYEEFSKGVLTSHWRLFEGEEKKRFVDLFTQFLLNLYLAKLQELYTDESVRYISQDKRSDSKALVAIKVLWKKQEIPADVWLLKRNAVWRIYDVRILGISFLRFYRAQFHSLLQKNSPEQVIERIEEKIEAQRRRHRKLPGP